MPSRVLIELSRSGEIDLEVRAELRPGWVEPEKGMGRGPAAPTAQLVGPTPCGAGRRLVPPACCCPPGGPRPTPPSRHQAQWNHTRRSQRARRPMGRAGSGLLWLVPPQPPGHTAASREAVGHRRGAQTSPARSLPHLLAAAAANPPSAMRGCLPLPPPPPGGRVGKSFKNQVVRRWCASHTPEPVALPLTKPVLAT